MNKHHLHQLLTRYRSGNCTEQERRLAEQWFALIDGEETHHSPQENQQIEERIWTAIQGNHGRDSSFGVKVLPLLFNWRWVAAAIFVIAVWGGYALNQRSRSSNQSIAGQFPTGMVSKKNNTAQPLSVILEDGTQVNLLPESSIAYPEQFRTEKREVYLKGKAFFDVTKDAGHPFLVYTGPIATKVLGTSFWVDVTDSSTVEVSVVTGKVSVFERNNGKVNVADNLTSGVILLPNQRVNYTASNQSFVKSIVSEPVMLNGYAGAFVFNDSPLTKVVELMERAYGVEIVLENRNLKNCLFTADINKQPMFIKLEMISAAVNADYEVRGTRIVLSGKGCPSN